MHASVERVRAVLGDDLAAMDDDHPVTDYAHLVEDVGGEQDRALAAQISDEIADVDHLIGVQADGRLVENQQSRLGDQCLRDPDTLAITLGKLADLSLANIAEPDRPDDRLDPAPQTRAREPFDLAAKSQDNGRRGNPDKERRSPANTR